MRQQSRQFIIYLLLAVLIVTAGGLGLDEKRQVFLSYHQGNESTLSKQAFTISNDLHSLELRDNTSAFTTIRGIKESKNTQSEAGRLLLVLLFVIFAGVFRCICRFCMQCAGSLLLHRMQLVRFIHDMDGKKRYAVSQ
ncbi:MAG: hypothetical protein MR029_04525 [Clostridium sp.]|nr:hypothetical protein [Clostridium sp.]